MQGQLKASCEAALLPASAVPGPGPSVRCIGLHFDYIAVVCRYNVVAYVVEKGQKGFRISS